MGSFSRLYDKLAERGVAKHDLTDVTYAIELLKSSGDEFSDIMYMWYGDGGSSATKEQAVRDARAHIQKLQRAIDRIEATQGYA